MDAPSHPARPTILAVADGWPWPTASGRAARIVEGLAAAGEVDLCVLVSTIGRPPFAAGDAARRWCRTHAAIPTPATRVRSGLGADTPARSIDRLQLGGHDQVWYLSPRALLLVGRRPAARIVVDLGGQGAPLTRRALRRVRTEADLVILPSSSDSAYGPDLPGITLPLDGDGLARTVAAVARTGAVPPCSVVATLALDLDAAGVTG